MKKGKSIIAELGEKYRFGPRDVEVAWQIVMRYFGSKEQSASVTEAEWELSEFCRKAQEMQKRSHVWATLAEVREQFQREYDEYEQRRRDSFIRK
jgi:hypothetical protein